MMSHDEDQTSKIKLVSESFVKPTKVLSNGATNQPHYLGVCGLLMLNMDTMQKGLLFNTKPNNVRYDILPKLKKSLFVSLVHFYPLAGELDTRKFEDEHACCIYVDCNKGPGARLIHASVPYTVSEIFSSVDVHPIVQSFFDLREKSINHDGHTRPLLSVQVTELIDGVFIGFTMNHCIADGTSLWHFISTLSELFTQFKDEVENEDEENSWIVPKTHEFSVSRKPVFKTVDLFPGGINGNGPVFKLPYLNPDEFITRRDPGPLRVRLFHFSHKSISMLKAQSNKECGLHNNISSFQALSGFLWRSITRARNLRPNSETTFVLVMNARTRFDPPLRNEYFRCFLATARGVSKAGELLNNGLGRAASLINQSIKKRDEKAFRKFIKDYEERPFVAGPGLSYKPNSLTIGGSSKFDMYGPEFGLGKAVAVLAGYASKVDGKVTANPGREGGGSVDLEICLIPETMNALELDEEFMSFVSST